MYKGVESLPVNTSRSLLVPSVLVSLVVEARGGAGPRGPETLARAPGQFWDNFLKYSRFLTSHAENKRFESRNPHLRKDKQAVFSRAGENARAGCQCMNTMWHVAQTSGNGARASEQARPVDHDAGGGPSPLDDLADRPPLADG